MAPSEGFQVESTRERLQKPRVRPALPQDDLRRIAIFQKAILFCILANLVVVPLWFILPLESRVFLALPLLAVYVTATVFVFLLATKVYGTGIGILLGILELVPFVGLIVLLIINGKATGVLQMHGIRVGLLGAKMSDFERTALAHPQQFVHERRGPQYDDEREYGSQTGLPGAKQSGITAEPSAAGPTRSCPRCGQPIALAARKCRHCKAWIGEEDDEPLRRPDDSVATIIPFRNPKALIAYYCGVFALIPCLGAILGPIALVLGILGLRYVGQHPTAKGTGHSIAGIVLGGLTLLFNWGGILFFVIWVIAQGPGK